MTGLPKFFKALLHSMGFYLLFTVIIQGGLFHRWDLSTQLIGIVASLTYGFTSVYFIWPFVIRQNEKQNR